MFGSKLAFAKLGNAYILAVSAADTVYFYQTTGTSSWTDYVDPISIPNVENISISATGNMFAAAVPSAISDKGQVKLYTLTLGNYVLSTTFTGTATSDRFGESISLAQSSQYIAIGSDIGNVYIYNTSSTSTPYQTITSITKDLTDQFGTTVQFSNDDTTLVVFATGASRVDIYDLYGTKFLHGESVTSTAVSYGASIATGNNTILVGAPNFNSSVGTVFSYVK